MCCIDRLKPHGKADVHFRPALTDGTGGDRTFAAGVKRWGLVQRDDMELAANLRHEIAGSGKAVNLA
jgi:hypothetical protein